MRNSKIFIIIFIFFSPLYFRGGWGSNYTNIILTYPPNFFHLFKNHSGFVSGVLLICVVSFVRCNLDNRFEVIEILENLGMSREEDLQGSGFQSSPCFVFLILGRGRIEDRDMLFCEKVFWNSIIQCP